MRARGVNAGIQRRRRAAQGLEAHRRRADRCPPEHPGVVHEQGQEGRLRLGTVDERQSFLGRESERREAGPAEGGSGGRGAAGIEHFAFAHQREGDVAQRRQIAARPDASLLRHPRDDAGVEERDERIDQVRPDAARRAEQHVGPKQHESPHHGNGQRRSDACRVAPDQIGLKLIELVGRHPDVGELPEARVDPVDGLPRRDRGLHQPPASPQRVPGGGGHRHLRVFLSGDAHHLRDRQRPAVEHARCLGHGPK